MNLFVKACFLIICHIIISCSYQKTEEVKYSNGKLKEITYITGKNIDSVVRYNSQGKRSSKKNFLSIDTLVTVYHPNGVVESEGIMTNDTLKSGWWKYYREDGSLKSKRHYFIKCDDYYLNQSIVFDRKGDTVYSEDDFNETIFFDYKLENINGESRLFYKISPISYRSKLELVLMTDNNFCSDEEKVDTVIQLKSRKGSIILNSNLDFKQGFVFDYYIDTITVEGNQRLNAVSRKIYFSNKK
jgi:hypothetical protein